MDNTHRVLDDNRMITVPIEEVETLQFTDDRQSIRIAVVADGRTTFNDGASHYVVVFEGAFKVKLASTTHRLSRGCFGSFPGLTHIQGEGRAIVVSSIGYRSPILAGGPIEEYGRLRYVDGCTSSILLPPSVRGEPCLNFMHLPQQTCQTMHTHPSLRAGIILSGRGQCATEDAILPFEAGTVFFIPPNLPHSFQSSDERLRVAIFHPDSDSGPTHTDHTMLNRTFIGGQSARTLSTFHTRG
jgi:mannose-6-phosphate isomerase-like protein (cupin superfamily)